MKQQLIVEKNDALLLPFLQAEERAADNVLSNLIQEHADPIISKILKTKLRVSLNSTDGDQMNQDALEMASDVRATLIADLHAVQQHPEQKAITSFRDYVAIKTYSACADYFRERNPRRWRLKNLLRYQLKHNPRFALWKSDNNYWQAGFAEWQDSALGSSGPRSVMPTAEAIREKLPVKPGGRLPAAR
ncbi:MAG TPA: hypothetical protein VGW36_08535, partial [Pyrinomonadaceae bacterium]|nr:hypothetical protein [Pyrinomonadaceae bacterium]